MKQRIISSIGLAVLVSVSLVTPALAVVSIDYAFVGNANNAADPLTGYGSVDHANNIGTYEVTNSQYAEFLNAKGSSNNYGVYRSNMESNGISQVGSPGGYSYTVTSGLENRPVVSVSWFTAARFINWLANGQGSGDTETGAYSLGGTTSGNAFAKISGATIYLPSENEWYKAAYYNGTTSSYSLYPNGQNSITMADANYWPGLGFSTDIGSYNADPSFYGTFDQGGNVWEWNDLDALFGSSRGLRGGSWFGIGDYDLSSSRRYTTNPSDDADTLGFRVASVPEPTSVILAIFGSGMMLIRRKR